MEVRKIDEQLRFMMPSKAEDTLDYTAQPLCDNIWAAKNHKDIIQDLMDFINSPELKPDKLYPFWSKVRIPNEKELQRLYNVRRNIQRFYNYPNPTGPIYFIGYTEEMADRWFMPFLQMILEMKLEKPQVEAIEVNGTIAF